MSGRPIITLLTDFGLEDPFVGVMKGVILGINPEAQIVDLCHLVRPQDVFEAAFILGISFEHFPPRTIHVAVVDPGVGTERKIVAVEAHGAFFIAPDNGILSFVLREIAGEEEGFCPKPREREIKPPFRAVRISNPRFWRHPVSRTFHGRDIFAPTAAHLSLGVPLEAFGEELGTLNLFPIPKPRYEPDGSIFGHVVHIDRFGNLITDVPGDAVSEKAVIQIGGHMIRGVCRSYAEGEGLLALVGSHNFLEIALKDGSAALALNARRGQEVRIKN